MKIITNPWIVFLVLSTLFMGSCEDKLAELNENPNGVSPDNVHPNLLLATVLTDQGFAVDTAGTAARATSTPTCLPKRSRN